MNLSNARKLLDANSRLIPGGLSSLNRRAEPAIAFARAKGARLWDVDGNEYIDYHAGFAPYLLGHNDDDVNAAVVQALQDGTSNYGSGPTREEGDLAALFLRAVPHAEKVQFFNTGSEATAQAIRVARAWTGRDHVVKMQGGYNGHHNAVAANLMTGREALGGAPVRGDEYPLVPITAGIPEAERRLMHAVPFNDLAALETVLKRHPAACVIAEPVLQNIGVVPPMPGYLEGLRALCSRLGVLCVFDEVKTGFRAGLAGYQGVSGVVADLSTYGKALANGFPIAALAGKARYLDLAVSDDATKRVLVAGTYNGHPVGVAAATACLRKLMDPAFDVYGRLERLARRLEEGQRRLLERRGVRAAISRVGSAHCVYFGMDHVPADWWDVLEHHDFDFDVRYRRALIERGIYHFPVAAKQGSVSYAHTEVDIDLTLEATDVVLQEMGRLR